MLIKKDKKAEMMWWLVMMIIALVFLLTYSFVSGGVVKKFVAGVGLVQDDVDERTLCIATPGSGLDEDGDGYIDDSAYTVVVDGKERTIDCSKFKGRGSFI